MATLCFRLLLMFGAALCVCSSHTASAQDYPNRYVRIVVPYAPGGSAEASARTVGDALSKIWKQPVVIENKPGAGTTIGATYVARSPADGYMLYLAGPSHTISPNLYANLDYDPLTSFAPVSMVADAPLILVVNPSSGIERVQDLVERARQKPGVLNYGTSGVGASPHLAVEMLIAETGIVVRHVPFRGSAPAVTALLGNFVDFAMTDVSSLGMIRSGTIKALAVTTAKRFSGLPNVPTMAEALGRDYQISGWSAILAPAGTPAEIVAFVNKSIAQALATPEVQSAFKAQGFETKPSSVDEAREFLAAEVKKYSLVAKRAGLKPQ